MIRCIFLALAITFCLTAESGADLARNIRDAGLDGEECYRVRDLNFTREDLKFYLNDGFLIFSKPVNGRRLSALFWAEIEGGDAEMIVLPPLRSERQSLGSFTSSPNLDEHFRSALFMFSDGSGEELLARARETGKKSAEQGLLLVGQQRSVVRNISESFQMRLVEDLMNPAPDGGLFFGAIAGTRLGNFDVVLDPRGREQVMIGQLRNKNNVLAYDVWSSFESRSVRKGSTKRLEPGFSVDGYRIEATLDEQLHLAAVTKVKIGVSRSTRVFAFQISDLMKVSDVRLDGQPVERFSAESLRNSALRSNGSSFFLVIAPAPLEPGQTHEFEFHHEGDVVFRAGNNVYAVGSRGTWYPHRASEFTTYDLTFRYPKRLTLVATGEIVDERTEGDVRVTHRRASSLVRFAGFNLGDYDKVSMNRGGYTIEIYGNRHMEPNLEPKSAVLPGPPRYGRRQPPDVMALDPPAIIHPNARLLPLAEEVAGAFEFFTRQFGPPPLKSLTVSPIPGAFGQGFPGLVYLSTIAYIQPEQRPAALREKSRQTFFSDLLAPHEVAHQWWGNLVTSAAYQDAWLMEALANYSALIYLEKRKGQKALEAVLDDYRANLLAKREDGTSVESLGPITWGTRLETSQAAAARTIVYEKGTWILHMLRLRMGDDRFFKMLSELCRRFQYKTVSTGAFRSLAEEFMPPGQSSLENFFENWVYGTGIPTLKLSSSVKGKAPALKVAATITQTDVDEDFSVEVPVEVQYASGPPTVKWVRTASDPVIVNVPVKRVPTKVVLPAGSVLAKR